jgi:predicted nucleic acid-binding Zn ribbon protein
VKDVCADREEVLTWGVTTNLHCRRCGKPISPDVEKCRHCGQPTKHGEAMVAERGLTKRRLVFLVVAVGIAIVIWFVWKAV